MLKKTAGLLLLMGLIAPLGGCPADEGGETTDPAVEEPPATEIEESPEAEAEESSEDEDEEGGEGGEGE